MNPSRKIRLALLILPALAVAAASPPEPAEEAGLFHYDLGPNQVDVSSYPARLRADYRTFVMACSRCPTLARPINAPYVERADWERYIKRMKLRSRYAGADRTFTAEEASRVLDFLVYDSRARKVEGRAAFEARDKELRRWFRGFMEGLAREREARTAVKPHYDPVRAKPVPKE
jgi:hypothetical protein